MEDESVLPEAPVPEIEAVDHEGSSDLLTCSIVGVTCAASLMHLSRKSEPYAHGAVTFLLVKSLLNTLERNDTETPGTLEYLNDFAAELARFAPWALLNAELYRRSGLFNEWNEASYAMLLAVSFPTALAAVKLNESYFNVVLKVVNGLNLAALAFITVKQRNYVGMGMTAICAMDCFLGKKLPKWLRLSNANTKNLLRACYAALVPLCVHSP